MSFQDKLAPILRILKFGSLWGSGGLFIAYHINQTYKTIDKVVNPEVLNSEKKYTPEYIYIDDPSYDVTLKLEHDKENKQSIGLARIWKSLRHSLAWRLLWLCRHGNREQRNVALDQLAAFKSNRNWDCLKLAQALDKNTAVLLARTRGADLRYFLPPPIHIRRAALTPELMSFKLRDILVSIQSVNPHSCIQQFICKHFTSVQDQAMEADSIPVKPDSISEQELCLLCLDAIHHHISIFHTTEFDEDLSAQTVIKTDLLPLLAELFLRNPNNVDLDLAILRIFTVLSVHCSLLGKFFQNGLIGELARLLRNKDLRLASSAAVCLANLSGEYCYRPGLYLLHPLYRTKAAHTCDMLLVHGLRGGVFVTWRQRDRKCAEPIGIMEVTMSNNECNKPCEENDNSKFIDPDVQQMLEDLQEMNDEVLLADFQVVLHDIPVEAKREQNNDAFTAINKRNALIGEEQDSCNYTCCWPKDWLPHDCNNLRLLGINYWSSLSEWLERCPMQTADIASRAEDLAPTLVNAGVGSKNVPVVWLAHSMGGLIVKQILIQAAESNQESFKKLSEYTKAVLFFGTPHRGSALATMPRAAAAVLWPSNDVRQLQVNSPTLLEMHETFLRYADIYNWETISFAETLPTLVTAFKVPVHFVESISADLGRGVFYQLPLDHLSICKPATRQSIIYTTVLDVLQRVTAKDVELRYTNPFVQWLYELFQKKASKMFEPIDDSHNNSDGLRWFEQLLLNTFTDGFTD